MGLGSLCLGLGSLQTRAFLRVGLGPKLEVKIGALIVRIGFRV